MANPLFHLARRLEKRKHHRRTLEAARKAQSDPHIARDLGLPYVPPSPFRADSW